MRIFVSGPINGKPNGNREAFNQRASELRTLGHEPVTPWDVAPDHDGPCIGRPVDHGSDHRYGCLFRKGLTALMSCEAVTFLEDWERSPGASLENSVARIMDMPILE